MRHFLTCQEGVPAEVEKEFATTFTPSEQFYIKTSMKGMFFFNLFFSTIFQGKTGSRVESWLENSVEDMRYRKERILQGRTGSKPVSLIDNCPEDVRYHKEHMWVRSDGTIGITFFAQDQLGEIVFIEVPEAGADIEAGEAFGEIESRKSVSDLYAPVSGAIKEVNSEAVDSPEIINQDPYGAGWIARVGLADRSELTGLLSAGEYRKLVRGEKSQQEEAKTV